MMKILLYVLLMAALLCAHFLLKGKILKHVLVVLIFAFISFPSFSQDLIVKSQGDSLNCKITKIGTRNIYFTYKHWDEVRTTILPLYQVKYYQVNYYQAPRVPAVQTPGTGLYPHFRVALNGGWSYRVAKLDGSLSSDFRQYYSELRSGYHYGLDLSYFVSDKQGFGVKYCQSNSKNSRENVCFVLTDGTKVNGKLSDNISIDFVGPFFSWRKRNAVKNNSWMLNMGLGYMGYRDQGVLIYDYTLKGSTLGIVWDIDYDIGISEHSAIGLQLSFKAGTLKKVDFYDGSITQTIELEKDHYEGLSRIDLTIGLRFNK